MLKTTLAAAPGRGVRFTVTQPQALPVALIPASLSLTPRAASARTVATQHH